MLFSIVKNLAISANDLINDLSIIHQWKMEFNPDCTKQPAEVLFFCKKSNPHHPDLIFNGTVVTRNNEQKYFVLILEFIIWEAS